MAIHAFNSNQPELITFCPNRGCPEVAKVFKT